MIIQNPAVRRYIYIVAAAVIAVLVLLGFVVEDQVQVWLNLVAALLGLPVAGLAAPNTPKQTASGAITQPGVINIYSDLTPGDHVIQADVAPTQHHLDYDANLTADETVTYKPTEERPPRTE